MANIEEWTFDQLMDFEDVNTISLGRDPDGWRSKAAGPAASQAHKGRASKSRSGKVSVARKSATDCGVSSAKQSP